MPHDTWSCKALLYFHMQRAGSRILFRCKITTQKRKGYYIRKRMYNRAAYSWTVCTLNVCFVQDSAQLDPEYRKLSRERNRLAATKTRTAQVIAPQSIHAKNTYSQVYANKRKVGLEHAGKHLQMTTKTSSVSLRVISCLRIFLCFWHLQCRPHIASVFNFDILYEISESCILLCEVWLGSGALLHESFPSRFNTCLEYSHDAN